MKYNQKSRYQKIFGKGRDCLERWEFIEPHLKDINTALDIGSAEGYFSRKLADKDIHVTAYEAGYPYDENVRLSQWYLKNNKIKLLKQVVTLGNIDSEVKSPDLVLLLSVLHWFENPDEILAKVASMTNNIIVELPAFDDTKSVGKSYMDRIKKDYKTIPNYLVSITNFKIVDAKEVSAKHVNKSRMVFFLKKC